MARLWSSGFELNSSVGGIEISNVQSTPIVQASVVRSGTYAAEISSLGSGVVMSFSQQFVSPAATGPFYFRTYFRYATLPTADNGIIRLGGTATGTTRISVKLSSTGELKIFNGTSTQIGSSSAALNSDTWYMVEILFDRSGGAGASIVELKIDGVSVASSSTETLSGNVLSFAVGGNLVAEAQTTGQWFFDDEAINDTSGSLQNTWPGEGAILVARPNAAGDTNTWLKTAGGAGDTDNYQEVDEFPPDDATTFIKSTTLDDEDFYNVTDLSHPVGYTPNLVQVGARFNSDNTIGNPTFRVQLKKTSGGTISQGAATTPGNQTWITNSTTLPRIYPLTLYSDPDGSPWTTTTLDSMQIGVKLTIDQTNLAQVTAVWALVEYVPAATAVQDIIGSGIIPFSR